MSITHTQEFPTNSFVFKYKPNDRTTPEDCLWSRGSRIRGYYLRVLDYFDREIVIFISQELLYRKYKRFFCLIPQVGLSVNLSSNSKGYFKAIDAEKSKDPSCSWILDVNCTIRTIEKISDELGLLFTESLQLFYCEVTKKHFISEPTSTAYKLKANDFYHFCEVLSSRGAVSICSKSKYLLDNLKREVAEERSRCSGVLCKPGVILVPVIKKLSVHYSRREARKYFEVTQLTEVSFAEVSRSTNTISLSDERARVISHAIRRGKLCVGQKGCLVRVSSSEEEVLSSSLQSESLTDPSAKVEEPSEESDQTVTTEPEQRPLVAAAPTNPASLDSHSSKQSSIFGDKHKRPRLLEALVPEMPGSSSLQSSPFTSVSNLSRHQASLSFSTPSKAQTARQSAKPKPRARLNPTESAMSLLSTNESKKSARLEDSGKHSLKSIGFEQDSSPRRERSSGLSLLQGGYLLSNLIAAEPEDPFNCLLSNGKDNIHSYYLSPDTPIKEED